MKFRKKLAIELSSYRAIELYKGLTLVEILIAITILAILAAVGIVAANPAGQVAKARNTQRQLNLETIMLYVRQNISDTSGGFFSCAAGVVPTSTKRMGSASSSYNIAPCLLLSVMPFDPSVAGAHWTSVNDYDTGYNIVATTSSPAIVTISAPGAELKQSVSISR